MSIKLPKRLSSKKKKHIKNNAQTEILFKLGLEAYWTTPLDPASMLDISTWTSENQAPIELKDLPKAFLQRLWLLHPDARSTCCKHPHDVPNNANEPNKEMINGFGESQYAINPLDLVTAVFMSANAFLQQEIANRMMQCQFAVPLVLPNIDSEESSHFLLWPLRGVVSHWWSHFPDKSSKIHLGDLASTSMPMVSCVKLGHCGVSKSQVLNNVLRSSSETFLHRGMDGGQLPRRLSNGLVEIGWYLPTGNADRNIFPVPVAFSNLRGDASTHEKNADLLCEASSAVIVFCGNLREKDKQLLVSWKDKAAKLILVDLSDTEINENRVVWFVDQNLEEHMGIPGGVLRGGGLSEEQLANRLCDTLKGLLPDKLRLVTLEAAATLAEGLGLNVDEGAVYKKAMATVEEALKGLDEGSDQFREKQLPLQGPLWRKLAEIEKDERKQRKEQKEPDPQLQQEKKDILAELSGYKMTPAMKIFTDALFTTDKVERTCFLNWMKLRLQLLQTQKQNSSHDLLKNVETENEDAMHEYSNELENGADDDLGDTDSFCTDSSLEEEQFEAQSANTELQVSEQKEHLDPICDPVMDQQLYVTSNEKEIQGEEMKGNSTEEQISDPVFEDQNCHMDPAENGALDKKEIPLAESDTTSSAQQQTCLDVSFEHHVASSSQSSEDQNCHLESGENGALSCQGKQPDEPDLPQDKSNSTPFSQEQMRLDVSFEHHQVASCSQPFEPDPSFLGLEHFLREMGLIFELTHISPGSGNQNVLRLPSLAIDLLLYGVPLELMDGDASNIPIHWLGCVFAELKRRLPQEQCRTRVLTNLGVYHARNAEVLSALFGVKFPEGRKRSTRGVYMVALCLPDNLRKDMECDFLLLIDVEGLCSDMKRNTQIHDNEMATVATGLSDVLMQNISSQASSDFETNFTVIVNALLRIKERGSVPICLFLAQDEGLNNLLQASQLKRVSNVLLTETEDRKNDNYAKTTSYINFVKGPWCNMSLSEPVDTHYSEAVLKLKQNLFGALKKCAVKSEATGLPEFMSRLCAVWDSVRADSFSIGLQDTDIALTFSLLCTELSQWEDSFLENMENWLMEATKKIFASKTKDLEAEIQNGLLSELKDEAREEVKKEVDKIRSKVEAYLMKDDLLKMNTFKPVLMSNIDNLQERVTEEIIKRVEVVSESHCSSAQLKKFETLLEREQESKLQALIENSKSTKVLLQDTELEEAFDGVWSKILSNFDFRPSETDDITARVTDILRENLISRGLQKHMKKLEDIGKIQTDFCVYDEYFGYRSRLKHMFENNNRVQRLEAQQVACNIIEQYNKFVADKSSSPADFSDSYVTELLENIEKGLKEKSLEIRSAFEVDLKVYLCSAACKDFQQLHDLYAKDRELLTCISAAKSMYLAEFIYQFRKRDQCQRLAQAFTSMVVKPTVLDYIYRPLGMHIVQEIQGKAPQYQSRRAFHQSLLEELIKEDCFESFLEYLNSYDNFRLRKVKETVVAYLSESSNLDKWRQQRLGEIVGKIAATVSETAEGTIGVLSDAKPLLERVCLSLEKYGDVDVNRASLDGPLFNITTEWDRFVTCLMELLATLRLDLVQEFSQNVDINQCLQCLTIQPHDFLFNKVRGCDKQCPLCRAPCEQEDIEHEVHRALLHRPKGMLPHCSCSLPGISCIENILEDASKYGDDMSGRGLHSLYPDWNISPEDRNRQMPSVYWRYVLARFNERFAKEYKQEPAKIPDDWKKITEEEALDSLKETFSG